MAQKRKPLDPQSLYTAAALQFPLYDSMEDIDTDPISERVRRTQSIIGSYELATQPAILEVGCGNADFLMALRSAGYQQALGVDARPRGIHKDAILSARAEALPFADETFHVVITNLVFDAGLYVQNHRKMLADIVRVLRPNGIYISRGDVIQARIAGFRVDKHYKWKVPVNIYKKT